MRDPGSKKRSRLRESRAPRVAITAELFVPRGRRSHACLRSRQPDRRRPAFTARRRSSIELSSSISAALASQSLATKQARKRSIHLACRVFQPTRLRADLVELRERGVDVRFVEDLAAADHVFDRQEVDRSPLGVEAFLRGPVTPMVTTAPRRSADARPRCVEVEVWCDVQMARMCADHVAGVEKATPPMVNVHPIRRGEFVPLECGVVPATTDHVCE